jgi:hypothetical protein
MEIQILGVGGPVMEKVHLFFKTYLKLCSSERERQVLEDKFKIVVSLIDELVQKNTSSSVDGFVTMAAAFLAGKFKMPVGDIIVGLASAEGLLLKQIGKK